MAIIECNFPYSIMYILLAFGYNTFNWYTGTYNHQGGK